VRSEESPFCCISLLISIMGRARKARAGSADDESAATSAPADSDTGAFHAELFRWLEEKGKSIDRIALRNIDQLKTGLRWHPERAGASTLTLPPYVDSKKATAAEVVFTCKTDTAADAASSSTSFTATVAGEELITVQFSKDLSETAQAKALRETRCQVDSVAMEALRNQVYQPLAIVNVCSFVELTSCTLIAVVTAFSSKCTYRLYCADSVVSAS
jgi:hypothetical protein